MGQCSTWRRAPDPRGTRDAVGLRDQVARSSLQLTVFRPCRRRRAIVAFLYDADADALRDGVWTGSKIHDGAEAAAIGCQADTFLETRPNWSTASGREDARTVR